MTVELKLADSFAPVSASLKVVAPGSLEARNSLEKPDAVRPEPGEVKLSGQTARFTLPALSAGAATFQKR